MGERALFIEHPSNRDNRYDVKWVKNNNEKRSQYLLPWWDLDKLPYTILGPYISDLMKHAFVDGLHTPAQRPSADDWETALVRTVDLMQPCQNPACIQKWFVFDNSTKPKCPFCGTTFKGQLPVLNFYSKRGSGNYSPDNLRLMVYSNQYLYQWHVNRNIFPNEKLSAEQKKPVGYFVFHNGSWIFINQTLSGMKDLSAGGKIVKPNEKVDLTDGKQILLSPEDGGRLIQVQLVGA